MRRIKKFWIFDFGFSIHGMVQSCYNTNIERVDFYFSIFCISCQHSKIENPKSKIQNILCNYVTDC